MKILLFVALLIAVVLASEYAVVFKEQVDFENLKHPFTLQKVQDVDFETKGKIVVNELKKVAELTQKYVVKLLQEEGADFTPFWITNTIILRNPSEKLLNLLQQREEISKIERQFPAHIIEPTKVTPLDNNVRAGAEWNVEHVKAPQAWQQGVTGKGIVVGILDTGLYWIHNDVKEKYRGKDSGHDYNWFDGVASASCKSAPCDQHGHGTHVTGTIVGGNPTYQVGVAIDAQFISCRAFATGSATVADILRCMQWFLAPTPVNGGTGDPSKRPHLVSNSWGSTQPNTNFNNAINALHAAGTLCVFAAGNSGSRCSSMGWPGGYEPTLAVAALGYKTTTIATFSSRGPISGVSYIKPEISAPGQTITSCSRSVSGYAQMSGTSMATPCTSGSIALMLSAKPELIGKVQEIKQAVLAAGTPIKSKDCSSKQEHPNNVYGWGEVDNLKQIE